MAMMLRVALALLSAQFARADARPKQAMDDDVILVGGSGELSRRDETQVGARLIERDARSHRLYVLFGQRRIRARYARLPGVKARVNRGRELVSSELRRHRCRFEHLECVTHQRPWTLVEPAPVCIDARGAA